MRGLRLKFWLDQLLSAKSLVTAGAAAVGLVGWATTHNPAFAWLMLSGSGAWAALMYYLAGHAEGDKSLAPNRSAAVREVEQALAQYGVPRREGERWHSNAQQLRRIAQLERLILTDLPATPSGVDMLSPEQQLDVADIVDQAVDLSRRRLLLIRALHANPGREVEGQLRDLIGRRSYSSERVSAELDELIALKREQAERIRRWQDDLHLVEINLDQIETFLRSLAYDQTVTPTNVSERVGKLKSRVQARRESVEELERRINEAVG